MIIKQIYNKKSRRVSKVLSEELGLGFNQIQRILRNKDIKISGKRISKDIEVDAGLLLEVYLEETKIKVIYEDENIVVVFKPRNLETVKENSDHDDLLSILTKQIGVLLYAVHRLDRNTEGLVIFAKNETAKFSFDNAIKNRNIEKYYLAKVVGKPNLSEEHLIAFLKKDEKNSKVYISSTQEKGYEIIKTNYKLISTNGEFSILEIELLTGRTHQIRAHLSFIGLPILGDEKYGNSEENKKQNKKYQCLCAYKLIFHFDDNDDYLHYLNGKSIVLDKNEIEFYSLN